MSQEQLAEKLEISVKHLSTLETGKSFVSAELLEKISEILEISPSALFYSAKEKSIDESDLSKIDSIIEEEFQKATIAAKIRIHKMKI
ncbi:MAG: helix-turn-helix transcriptional regulator [Treponema sp.]|nr:helix-turn-helix transcriptional regulator [Treponema sp.]